MSHVNSFCDSHYHYKISHLLWCTILSLGLAVNSIDLRLYSQQLPGPASTRNLSVATPFLPSPSQAF